MPSSQTAVQKEEPQHHFHPTVTPLEKEGSGGGGHDAAVALGCAHMCPPLLGQRQTTTQAPHNSQARARGLTEIIP